MPARKSKQPAPEPKRSRYQSFETETIRRDQIKGAPYNPRFIDDAAKKRLKAAIRKHGLVEPLTWNRRTGNLVGGHQRLDVLDALERSRDYELTVSVIDVDEQTEAELNVQLNNPSMQGEWDIDKLAGMIDEFDFTAADLGFSELDIDLLFDGDDRFSKLYETPEVEETEDHIAEVRESRAEGKRKLDEGNNINWYVIIVFHDEAEREAFMKRISVPAYEQYITGEQVERIKQA